MCEGFGGIVTQDGRVFFSEPDKHDDCSHSVLLDRLKLEDSTGEFIRPFVRFQFPQWTEASFEWDEDGSLPGWVTDEHKEAAVKTLLRIAPAWAEYMKVRDAAYDEHMKVRDAAYDEYMKVRDAAYAEYEKVSDAAYAEYEKVRDAAYDELIQRLSRITGYVPAK